VLRMFRRRRLVNDLRPPLARDERIVAWAGAVGDSAVVATNLGLWLPGAAERIGWHEIHKATWSGRQLTVTAAATTGERPGYAVVEDLPPVTVTLLDPDRVPEQVRARVDRSVAASTHHPLPGGGGVRIVARRVPGIDGLSWVARYDPGTAPADAVDELVAQAKAGIVGAGG